MRDLISKEQVGGNKARWLGGAIINQLGGLVVRTATERRWLTELPTFSNPVPLSIDLTNKQAAERCTHSKSLT